MFSATPYQLVYILHQFIVSFTAPHASPEVCRHRHRDVAHRCIGIALFLLALVLALARPVRSVVGPEETVRLGELRGPGVGAG